MSTNQDALLAGRYRIVGPVGQGGMGRVWLARDEVLGRDVALKELVPPAGLTPDEQQDLRTRSLREARALARLNHPNVVKIFDVVRQGDGDPWIVMEYVTGRSLQQILDADGPLPPARVAHIGLGVLAALEAGHRTGMVHRDVKPGNVLLADDGRVVLTDFGLAIVAGDPHVTRTGQMFGSPAYMAPERAIDGIAEAASDMWSLGATLYSAVEGHPPYPRPTAIAALTALASEPVPPPRQAGPLKPLLQGLLRKDPARRLTGAEAARLLHRVARRWPLASLIRPAAGALGYRGAASVIPAQRAAPAPEAVAAPPPAPATDPTRVTPPAPAPAPAAPVNAAPTVAEPAVVEPAEANPAEVGPGEAKPGEAVPGEAVPGDAGPGDARPGDAGPGDARPGDARPGKAKPVGSARVSAAPANADPTRAELVGSARVNAEPVSPDPKKAESAEVVPTNAVPTNTEPDHAEPAKAEPAKAEPAKAEPVEAEPEHVEPVGAEPPARPAPVGTAAEQPTVTAPPNASPGPDSVTSPSRPAVSGAAPATSPAPAQTPAPAYVAAARVAARQPGRHRVRIAVLVAVALLAVVVAVPLLLRGHGTGARASLTPPTSGTPTGANGSAAPSPTAGTSSAATTAPASPSGFTLPPGWSMQGDGTGFAVPVPDGWQFGHDSEGRALWRDPGHTRLLLIDQTRHPKPDPVQDWMNNEAARRGGYQGYQRVKIVAVDYWDSAADWEFTYTLNGTRLHVLNRGFVTAPDQAYSIYWSTPDAQWAASDAQLQVILAGFHPARS